MNISGEVQSQNGEGRFAWIDFEPPEKKQDDGAEVIAGLSATPKTLPPKYFYDDPGSLLFEQITEQPEYYPTRTEESILVANAADIVAQTGPCELVELGSGSASKTRVLIEAYFEDWREEADPRETSDSESDAVRFIPVDVSGGILKSSSRELLTLYPDLNVWGLVGTYEQALDNLPPRDLKNRMVLFLGSTIGNLSND
jgi:L-histidine Nalpha-methyltransferase